MNLRRRSSSAEPQVYSLNNKTMCGDEGLLVKFLNVYHNVSYKSFSIKNSFLASTFIAREQLPLRLFCIKLHCSPKFACLLIELSYILVNWNQQNIVLSIASESIGL